MTRTCILITLMIALALAGCLERKLQIKSEPAGALVYLADEEIGRTPLEVDFAWYGDYEVTLRLDSYDTLQTNRRIYAPFWEYPPIDLLCEIVPWTISNKVQWDFKLSPQTLPTDAELLKNSHMRGGQLPIAPARGD